MADTDTDTDADTDTDTDTDTPAVDGTPLERHALVRLLEGIEPHDALEAAHQQQALAWVQSGAPVYRTAKPDVPDPHLVAYFVVLDETRFELLLVDHRKAGRWLPPGGHVDPGEDPWHTVVRECEEELSVPAVPSALSGDRPFFVSVNTTSPPGSHTDISLWYVVALDRWAHMAHDPTEFAGVRWVTVAQVLQEPPATLDNHLPRCAAKLLGARDGRATLSSSAR